MDEEARAELLIASEYGFESAELEVLRFDPARDCAGSAAGRIASSECRKRVIEHGVKRGCFGSERSSQLLGRGLHGERSVRVLEGHHLRAFEERVELSGQLSSVDDYGAVRLTGFRIQDPGHDVAARGDV
ncbi:MAG: hypothetical protein RIT81_18015 [Deltaproteobacteria bacterium]